MVKGGQGTSQLIWKQECQGAECIKELTHHQTTGTMSLTVFWFGKPGCYGKVRCVLAYKRSRSSFSSALTYGRCSKSRGDSYDAPLASGASHNRSIESFCLETRIRADGNEAIHAGKKAFSTMAGFEPTRGNPSRFRICRLNPSATLSWFHC